jgi:hypothetical protein
MARRFTAESKVLREAFPTAAQSKIEDALALFDGRVDEVAAHLLQVRNSRRTA